MATITPISATLRLTFDLGMEGDKRITKSVSFGNIVEDTSANALAIVANALAALAEYPLDNVRKYSSGLLVM